MQVVDAAAPGGGAAGKDPAAPTQIEAARRGGGGGGGGGGVGGECNSLQGCDCNSDAVLTLMQGVLGILRAQPASPLARYNPAPHPSHPLYPSTPHPAPLTILPHPSTPSRLTPTPPHPSRFEPRLADLLQAMTSASPTPPPRTASASPFASRTSRGSAANSSRVPAQVQSTNPKSTNPNVTPNPRPPMCSHLETPKLD